MNLKLKIYDNAGKKVKKEVEAATVDIMFGTVLELMELLDIENTENTVEILKKVTGAWKEVTRLLNTVFPGVTKEEWKNVKVKELFPCIMEIVKFALKEMVNMPTDPNSPGE